MNFLPTAEAAVAFIVANQIPGRKFEVEDLTDTLAAAARMAAIAWQSPSPTYWANNFMADMKIRAGSKKGMSAGQAKGVLNVIRAEATPKAPKSVEAVGPALNISKVRTARFRVVAEDETSIALRISVPTMWTDAPKGTRKLSVRTAEGWTTVGKVSPEGDVNVFKKAGAALEARVRQALTTLANADDDLVYILAFALEGNECGFCGLELDTQESLLVGYGPTCAKKHDLPWGAKAVPAKVLLAKKGLAEAPEAEVVAEVVEAPVATSTVEEVIATLEAAVAAAQADLLVADDDDAAFAKFVSAKNALKAAKAAAVVTLAKDMAAKLDYDLQLDTDGAVITGAGIVLRPLTQDDWADDLAAAADLANDVAAGN